MQIKAHSVFQRDHNDLHCEMPVSFTTAALGGDIEIPTLDGYAKIKIPAETQSGKIFRLRGKGIKGVRATTHGDLMCQVGKAGSIADTENRFASTAGGYQFTLELSKGNQLPTKSGQARHMRITVTDPDGKPVTILEPVMNAFAPLVGFYDDCKTVIHLHPTGGDVLNPELRGGPTLGFILFAPKPGFIRLYCQVSIGGRMLFAPFNLNVDP